MPSCSTRWPPARCASSGLKFSHTLCDIETLNRKALEGFYDVTAISFHAYPYIQEKYALLASGGSVGEGYGPMIVAPRMHSLDEIKRVRIAIPGKLTTAYLVLKLFAPEVETVVVPFDKIIPEVLCRQARGRTDHPRGPAHLRQVRAAPHCRSGQVVARLDRAAAAARRQRHPPRPGPSADGERGAHD